MPRMYYHVPANARIFDEAERSCIETLNPEENVSAPSRQRRVISMTNVASLP